MRPSEWLKGLEIQEPQVAKDIFAVFPLTVSVSDLNGRFYLTLDEAISKGLACIPESRRIREIIVNVEGEEPVLVVEGTVLVGGLQNRTVNISLLLEAGKEQKIPVSCVERRRWYPRRRFHIGGDGEVFEVASCHAHAQLRVKKTESTVQNYVRSNRPNPDQFQVWEEVERKLQTSKVNSPTKDETSFYERNRSSVEEFLKPIEVLEGQVGALIAVGQNFIGLEVFDHPETWQVMHRKILSSYAADALEVFWSGKSEGLVKIEGAKNFVDNVARSLDEGQVKPAPVGLGEHHLLNPERDQLGGFGLVFEDLVLHLFSFPHQTSLSRPRLSSARPNDFRSTDSFCERSVEMEVKACEREADTGIDKVALRDFLSRWGEEANKVLTELSHGKLKVWFDLRPIGRRRKFDVLVSDGDKRIPLAFFASGERFRVEFSLLVALRRLQPKLPRNLLEAVIGEVFEILKVERGIEELFPSMPRDS